MTPIKKINVLPNLITAFGLACGLFVIFKVNMTGPDSEVFRLLLTSSVLLLVISFADVMDGAIARVLHGESDFGVMFDSLADAVSFGVAPSVLLLKSLSLEQGTTLSFFVTFAAMLYSMCGILRLVRFNVKATQIKGDELAMASFKKSFTGLPIPAAACAMVSINLFLHSPWFKDTFLLSEMSLALTLGIAAILIGCLMVSHWKFLSLKTLRFRTSSFYLVFFTVITAVFLFYGILNHFPLVFFVVSWGYLLLGCLLTLIRMIAGKRSKALTDFDPDIDELE